MEQFCEYYHVERNVLHSKSLGAGRHGHPPQQTEKAFCTHSESIHRVGTIGSSCPCEGDINKCVIPNVWD